MGAVVSRHRPIVVDEMERHVHTFELLYPHGHALIQPLALPLDSTTPTPNQIRRPSRHFAFPLARGSSCIQGHGTARHTEFEDTTYSFACMEPDFEYVPGWVPFPNDDVVRVIGA